MNLQLLLTVAALLVAAVALRRSTALPQRRPNPPAAEAESPDGVIRKDCGCELLVIRIPEQVVPVGQAPVSECAKHAGARS